MTKSFNLSIIHSMAMQYALTINYQLALNRGYQSHKTETLCIGVHFNIAR